ncbi:hypothetical protein V757_02310 [Pelistega indica]|uniref:Uncharacterized protein n=1 Tax=Pelistega indica TaxID=1414851 RepID=V8GAP9_9BURK|nr:hypothetical protein [Pelistega indica]ETD72792.1 hypothetical protein V757_02310 [Pelistega indica]
MSKHKHAELMMQYAQDAMETDKPWERWEVLDDITNTWRTLTCAPFWVYKTAYRRKIETIKIGNFEFPKPEGKYPEAGAKYYYPALNRDFLVEFDFWGWNTLDVTIAESGLLHLSEENARKHAEVLVAISQGKTSLEDEK